MDDRRSSLRPARLVARDNRFVVRASLARGREVRAYLPNTARLAELLVPGRKLLLRRADDPARRTGWTVHRLVDDGALVSLDAPRAPDLVEGWLHRRGTLPGLGPVAGWEREVPLGGRRLDFRLHLADGRDGWLEVKSLSVARDRTARFSRTPSVRGGAHLAALAAEAAAGRACGCAFVVQRGDADRLAADREADPGWLAAVREAAAVGVAILAFGCRVDESAVRIERPLPVELDDARSRSRSRLPPHAS